MARIAEADRRVVIACKRVGELSRQREAAQSAWLAMDDPPEPRSLEQIEQRLFAAADELADAMGLEK